MDDKEADEIAADLLAQGLDPGPSDNHPVLKDEEYPDWSPETTRVISGPLRDAKFPGTRYLTWQEAATAASGNYTVVKFWVHGPRWFARIKK